MVLVLTLRPASRRSEPSEWGTALGVEEAHPIFDIVDLDFALMERNMTADRDDQVIEFTTKELLVEIRESVKDLGRTTRADMAELQRSVRDDMGALRSELSTRVKAVEDKQQATDLWRAKVIGIAVGVGAAAGGLSGFVASLAKHVP